MNRQLTSRSIFSSLLLAIVFAGYLSAHSQASLLAKLGDWVIWNTAQAEETIRD